MILKRILSVAIMIVGAFGAFAQQPQMQPLPLNPAVKHGTLPNGLQYFIMHNEEPKERANFYIAQKVGSTLETSEQLGLAHFLEHMDSTEQAITPERICSIIFSPKESVLARI